LDIKEDTRACSFWILKKIPEHAVFWILKKISEYTIEIRLYCPFSEKMRSYGPSCEKRRM